MWYVGHSDLRRKSTTKRVPLAILNLHMNNSIQLLRRKLYMWPGGYFHAIIRQGSVRCVGRGKRNSKFVSNFSIKWFYSVLAVRGKIYITVIFVPIARFRWLMASVWYSFLFYKEPTNVYWQYHIVFVFQSGFKRMPLSIIKQLSYSRVLILEAKSTYKHYLKLKHELCSFMLDTHYFLLSG